MHTRLSVKGGAVFCLLAAAICFGGVARGQIAGENVNMVSGVRWPGGDPYLQRQNEPTVAVSSVNAQHLVAGANDYRSVDVPDPAFGAPIVGDAWLGVFKSFDGGQTWSSVLLPGYPQECSAVARENERRASASPPQAPLPVNPLCGYPAAADPVMRAGTDGLFYFAGINFQRDKSRSRIFVARFIDDNNKENGSPTGDPAAYDPASPTQFTPTDPIRYVDTAEVWSSERNKAEYPAAPAVFMDKPWMAVDIPRSGASCRLTTASGASILAGNVYVAWTQFYPDDYQSDVMISWSTNCGETWTKPRKVNTGNSVANQGVTLAIEPVTGRVYIAWRRAAWPYGVASPRQTDAIMVSRSEGRQRNFSAPRAIAKVIPFDMGSGWGRARTQTMPTMAIATDGKSSWTHLAWAGRVAPSGEAKIFTSSARVHPKPAGDDDPDDPEEIDDETRIAWTTPALADASVERDDAGNTFTRGHQYMPSLAFGQGRLMLFYYDTRLDHTVRYYRPIAPVDGRFYEEELGPRGELAEGNDALVFGPEIDDGTLSRIRHTVDVRVASLPWGGRAGGSTTLVSRFPLGIRGDETNPAHVQPAPALPASAPGFGPGGAPVPDKLGIVDPTGLLLREQQLQLNIPGFAMFKGGKVAFMGDYVDIQGSTFVPLPGGWWAFDTAPSASPVFHAVWTSNQDVKTPWDGDWTRYTPVTALAGLPLLYDGGRAGPVQTPVLVCDPGSVGSRDQNIYTSRITEGLQVSSPQNVKPLASGYPSAEKPTSFVIVARNATGKPMTVLFAASASSPVTVPPPASPSVHYSFTPQLGSPLTSLCATIAPKSSVTRTLFAQLEGVALASAPLYVQVDEVASCAPGAARTGRSGSITLNPPVAFTSLVQPDGAGLPQITDGETYAVVMAAPSLSNPNPAAPSLSNSSLSNPSLSNPSLSNPSLSNPSLSNPSLSNPSLSNPSLSNPSLSNPSLSNPSLSNPSLSNPSLSNPSLSNSAPWDSTQTLTNSGNTATSYHVKVVGDGVDPALPLQLILGKTYFTPTAVGCELKEVPHDQLVASIPDLQNAIVSPGSQVDPGASDSSLSNATIALAPGESATITLRGYMPPAEMAKAVGKVQPVPLPAAITPQPGVTYETFRTAAGQPLLKPTPLVRIAIGTGAIEATVSADPSWVFVPSQPITGSVTFIRGSSEIVGTVALDGSGRAEIAASVAPAQAVTALYGGDASYSSASATFVRPAGGTITISPASASVAPLGTIAFSAVVAGTADQSVIWSVLEGAAGGTISAAGLYTAPATPGIYTVVATSVADPTRSMSARVTVSYGAWTAGVPSPARANSPGTAVSGGKIYVIGGAIASGGQNVPTGNVQVYDPTTSTWTLKTPMPTARWGLAAVAVGSRIYAFGGTVASGTGFAPVLTNEVYDVATDTWSTAAPLPTAAATVYAAEIGGRIYAVLSNVAAIQIYEPTTDSWSAGAPMATLRADPGVAAVGGKLYVLGGISFSTFPYPLIGSVEEYDPASDTWTTKAGAMPTPRGQFATAVLNHHIYAISGHGPTWMAPSFVTEVYDPVADAWSSLAPIPNYHAGPAAAAVGAQIYVIGGNVGTMVDVLNP